MGNNLVNFNLCEENPGALTFMMEAYNVSPFQAEAGFQRMAENGISGSKLYMLWNDCCNRDTIFAMNIMRCENIKNIIKHINYGNGYGIPFEKQEVQNE